MGDPEQLRANRDVNGLLVRYYRHHPSCSLRHRPDDSIVFVWDEQNFCKFTEKDFDEKQKKLKADELMLEKVIPLMTDITSRPPTGGASASAATSAAAAAAALPAETIWTRLKRVVK
jgi:hypothetical protein